MEFTESHLDHLSTTIQETGTAVDLPEYLLAAAKQLGIKRFSLTDLGVVLYRINVIE